MNLKNMTWETKYKVAGHYNTPADTLRELAKDEDWFVRNAVASNPNTPIDILRELLKYSDSGSEDSTDDGIKASVAENPNTPIDVLFNLAKNDYWLIGERVAHNSKSSSNVLVRVLDYEKSLTEPERDVIYSLYKHKNLPYIAKVIIETLFRGML